MIEIEGLLNDELERVGVTVSKDWKRWVCSWLRLLPDPPDGETFARKFTFIGNSRLSGDIDADVLVAYNSDGCHVQLRPYNQKRSCNRRRFEGSTYLTQEYARVLLGIDQPAGLPSAAEVEKLWGKFLAAFENFPETPPSPVLLCTADVKQYPDQQARRVLVDVPICLLTREIASAAVVWPKPKKLWRWGRHIVLDGVQAGDVLELAAHRRRLGGEYCAWYGLVLAVTNVFLAAIPLGDRLLVEISRREYAKHGIRLFRIHGTKPARVLVRVAGQEMKLPLRELSFRSIAESLGMSKGGLFAFLRIYKTNPREALAIIRL